MLLLAAENVELGGGSTRTGEASQREYVRHSIAAPELGPNTLYANLGRAADRDDFLAIKLAQEQAAAGRTIDVQI